MLEERFSYILEGIYIIIRWNSETDQFYLKMQKIDVKSRDVVLEDEMVLDLRSTEMILKDYKHLVKNEKIINLSSERISSQEKNVEILRIYPGMKNRWSVLKRWVQIYSEIGLPSIKLHYNLEPKKSYHCSTLDWVISFLDKAEIGFIDLYCDFAEKSSKEQGILNETKFLELIRPVIQYVSIYSIPDKYRDFFIHDKVSRRYILRNRNSIKEMFTQISNNPELLKECDYEEIEFIWVYQSELIKNYLTLNEDSINKRINSLEIPEILEILFGIFSEGGNNDEDTINFIKKCINLVPPSLFFQIELPSSYLMTMSEFDFERIEEILKNKQKMSFLDKNSNIFYVNFSFLISEFRGKHSESLIELIYHNIPVKNVLNNEDKLLFWYLRFLGKTSKISDYVIKSLSHMTTKEVLSNLDKLKSILILQNDSDLFPADEHYEYFYDDYECLLGLCSDAYNYNEDDWEPFPMYLKDSKRIFNVLIDLIPVKLLIMNFSFRDLAMISEGFDFLPKILKKIIPISENPEFNIITDENKVIHEFLDEMLRNIIISHSELDKFWIDPLLRDSYIEVTPLHNYYSPVALTIKNISHIIPILYQFEFPKKWDRIEWIFYTILMYRNPEIYSSYLFNICELDSHEVKLLIKLSNLVKKPILKTQKRDPNYRRKYYREGDNLMEKPKKKKISLEYWYPDYIWPVFTSQESHVIELYLPNLNLNTIPIECHNFPNLKILILNENKIKSISDVELKAISNLEVLDISKNKIAVLGEGISSLEHLNVLNLRGNKLNNLPIALSKLRTLQILNISNNKFIEIPQFLRNLTNLEYLEIHGNDLNPKSPKSFQILRDLKEKGCKIIPDYYTNVEDTKLEICPVCQKEFIYQKAKSHIKKKHPIEYQSWIYQKSPSEIQAVSIFGKVFPIHRTFRPHPVSIPVKKLDLQHHKGGKFMSEKKFLQGFGDKKIKNLENIERFDEYKYLEQIDISGHEIENIDILSKFKKLEWINLSSNKVENISVLKKLKNLRCILLDCNNISTIKGLENIPWLTLLSLRDNQITDFQFLSKLEKLIYLDLYNNLINDLSGISNLFNLKYLNLENNKINEKDILYLYNLGWKNGYSEENYFNYIEGKSKKFSFIFYKEDFYIEDFDFYQKLRIGYKSAGEYWEWRNQHIL